MYLHKQAARASYTTVAYKAPLKKRFKPTLQQTFSVSPIDPFFVFYCIALHGHW